LSKYRSGDTLRKIVILGGGTGGLAAAKHLSEALGGDAEITLIDRRDRTDFRPSYLYVMMGYRESNQVSAPLSLVEKRGVRFVKAEVRGIDPGNRVVETAAGKISYDYLLVSLGAETRPDLVKGGPLPHPWELDGALEVRKIVRGFRKGRLVVAVHSTPYRCPPAPWEVALLLDFYYSGLGFRRNIEITMVHPFKRPFENFGPLAAKMMEGLMAERKVGWVGVGKNPAVEEVDPGNKVLVTTSGERIRYDALILIPPHMPPEAVAKSDIADPQTGWAKPTPPTMRTKYDDVYAVGDVAAPSLRLGMAGVILHSYLKYPLASIISEIKGVYVSSEFRVFGSCVMDVGGFGMAAACDFTKLVLGQAQYPDCLFLPPTSFSRVFKEMFEKQYFAWLLGYEPG
jgi:sulfide:quinone oxidoreductase